MVDRLGVIEQRDAAWAEVDRLRATTVDREHFDRKIREWIALYDEEQAKRRAVERQLAGAVDLSDAEADALDRLLDAYLATEEADPGLDHLRAIRAKLAARGGQ